MEKFERESLAVPEAHDLSQARQYGPSTEGLLYLISAFIGPPVSGISIFLGLWVREDVKSRALAVSNLALSLLSTVIFLLAMILGG